jgi:hypothetical protein
MQSNTCTVFANRANNSMTGTKTAARGRKAHQHVSKEIVELCEVIWNHGQMKGITELAVAVLH